LNSLKIAQVICTFPPYKGGMGNSVWSFSRELAALGHDVTVFTPCYPSHQPEAEAESPDFNVVRLKPVASKGNAAVLPQLLWRLKGFDAVHLHYPFYGSAAFVALRKLIEPSTRLCVYYHMDTDSSGLKGTFFRLYRRTAMPFILSLADEVTCSSFDYISHSHVASYYFRHEPEFDEVCYGVDSDFFKPGEPPRDGDRVILFVGALISQNLFKGLKNLLLAFEAVSRQKDDCRLMVVGRGNMEDYYHHLADSLDIGHLVDFVNDADDAKLAECYRSCNMAVLPSTGTDEAFGLVLLEAMACGRPVIASNLPGVRTTFEDGKQGLLVEPGNINDLADKISALLDNEEMARQFGEAGRERVMKCHSWPTAAKKLEEIYAKKEPWGSNEERSRLEGEGNKR